VAVSRFLRARSDHVAQVGKCRALSFVLGG
jgi:hypothetical protein